MAICLGRCDREEDKGCGGYCDGHYRRWKAGKPLDTPLRSVVKGGAKCPIVDDAGRVCGRDAVSGGICPTHKARKERGLDLHAPVRSYVQTDDLQERLNHYAPPGDENECWEWQGCLNKGQGMVTVANSKLRGAHIVAWELANARDLPDGMVIRHTCDNSPCVNPAHLILGTHQENVADKVERGRQDAGEKHGLAKLTNDEVLEVCRLYDAGLSQRVVAEKFSISQGNVSLIIRGKAWGHITGRSAPDRPRHVKLSFADAEEIRQLYATGAWTHMRLAKNFGVSRASVSGILAGKIWPSTS